MLKFYFSTANQAIKLFLNFYKNIFYFKLNVEIYKNKFSNFCKTTAIIQTFTVLLMMDIYQLFKRIDFMLTQSFIQIIT